MKRGSPNRESVRGSAAALVCGTCLILGSLPLSSSRAGETKAILDYRQTATEIVVVLDRPCTPAKYLMIPEVPVILDASALAAEAIPVESAGASVRISLSGEPTAGEYSIVLFLAGDYVELVRQSEAWLEREFSFRRAGGYTILGRRSIQVGSRGIRWADPLVVNGRPDAFALAAASVSEYDEIDVSAGLLGALWNRRIRQGPIEKSYRRFLKQPFEDKLRQVRDGDFAVMCTGFRDLFAHAALSIPGLKVRLVEAANYAPRISGLISYSHSTAEIWVEALGKWVIFDPWLAIVVEDHGTPIGVEELLELKNSDAVSITPVLPALPRKYRRGTGEIVDAVFEPDDVQAVRFTCGSLGCSPGYLDYFGFVKLREVRCDPCGRAP